MSRGMFNILEVLEKYGANNIRLFQNDRHTDVPYKQYMIETESNTVHISHRDFKNRCGVCKSDNITYIYIMYVYDKSTRLIDANELNALINLGVWRAYILTPDGYSEIFQ